MTPEYRPFFVTAWHTGLRIGELVGLKWSDVDWNKKAITIRRSIYQTVKKDIVTIPKARAGKRTIFMTSELEETLNKYRKRKKSAIH